MADGFYEEFMGSGDTNPNTALDVGETAIQAEMDTDTDESNVDNNEKGQESDTPTDTDDGQTSESQTDTDTDTGSEKSVEESESESSTDTGKEEKPLPFDKDPKWIAARSAEKRLSEILEKHGYESAEDLESALSDGKSLIDLIGDSDAKQLVNDSKELKTIKDFWAEEETAKIEKNETAEDKNKRLKEENTILRNKMNQDEADRKIIKDNEKALRDYEKTVTSMIENDEELSPDERGLVGLMLGVDNPMDDVDILDTRAVKETAKKITGKLTKYIADIKQQAIDDYSKGKSKITPSPTGKVGSQNNAVKKKKLPANASVEDTFADANAELLETLKGIEWEM